MSKHQIREDLVINTKTAKTFDEIDAEMRDTYFSNKVDMTPATIKTVSTCLDGENETVVSRILEVDGKPFMGIDYAEGKPVGAWMADAKGRRVPIKMPEEQKEQKEIEEKLHWFREFLEISNQKNLSSNAKEYISFVSINHLTTYEKVFINSCFCDFFTIG